MLAVCLLAAPAFGQTFSNIAIQNGPGGFLKAAPFAPVYLCQEGATSVAGCSLQTLYTNSSLSTPISPNAPTVSDGSGNFTFYAAPGKYAICIVGVSTFCQNVIVGSSAGAGGGGNVSMAPGAGINQNIVQQSGTTFSSNIDANKRVVTPSWNWSQTDVAGSIGDLSAAGASKTLTLPAGILGIDVTGNTTHQYQVYISGVGTPEGVPVTGGTYTSGAGGTIIVTTVNTHAAGFTVGSGSQGIAEAWNDAKGSAAAAFKVELETTQNTAPYVIHTKPVLFGNNGTLEGNGALLSCQTRDSCFLSTGNYLNVYNLKLAPATLLDGVQISDVTGSGAAFTVHTASAHAFVVGDCVAIHYWVPAETRAGVFRIDSTADNTHFVFSVACNPTNAISHPVFGASTGYGFAAIENAAAENNGNGNVYRDVVIYPQVATINNRFSYGFINDNDQNFTFDRSNLFASTDSILCNTANFCGAFFWQRGDAGNAGIPYISNVEASFQCSGNGFLLEGGNSASIHNAVIQGFNQYGIYNLNGSGQNSLTADDIYQEASPGCANKIYPNGGNGATFDYMAGIISSGGQAHMHGVQTITGLTGMFAAGGGAGAQINYFVVPHSSIQGVGPVLGCGIAQPVNGAVTVQVYCPALSYNDNGGSSGTITYDLLATAGSSPTPLFGTGNWAIGTTLSCTPSTVGLCNFTDTQAARSPYTVAVQQWLFPQVGAFWPGNFFLSSTDLDIDLMYWPGNNNSTRGITTRSIHAKICGGASGSISTALLPPIWFSCGAGEGDIVEPAPPMILQTKDKANNGAAANSKGILVIQSEQNFPNCEITLETTVLSKLLASPTFRVAADATDTCLGHDSLGAMSISANSGISAYIGIVPDNANWKERLTSSLKSFTVPIFMGANYIDSTEQAAPANPAASTERLYADSTSHTLKCLTNSGGNCLPTGTGTVTNTGASLPSNAVVLGNTSPDIKADTGLSTDGAGAMTTTSGNTALTHTQGTITTSKPTFSHTVTWNASGVAFTNWLSNIICTAAATGSVLAGWGTAGTQVQLKYGAATCANPQLLFPAGATAALPNIGSTTAGSGFGISGGINPFMTRNGTALLAGQAAATLAVSAGMTLCFVSGSDALAGTCDTGISRSAANVLAVGNGATDTTGRVKAAGYMSVGTTFTSNAGCTESALTGGATAGKFTVGQNTACTIIITMGNTATAPNGWTCTAYDQTAVPAVAIRQTASNATTCSLLMTVATNDVITFSAIGY